MHVIEFWRQAPILLAAPAQLAFVLIVTIPRFGAGQWWRRYVTRAVVELSGTLLLLILAASVGYVINDASGPQVVDWRWPDDGLVVACYWLVSAAIWSQLAALVRQRFAR